RSATWFGLNCYARVSSVRIYDRVLTDAEINDEVGIGAGAALGSAAQATEAPNGFSAADALVVNLEAGSYSGSGDWNDPITGKGAVLEGGVTWESSTGVPAFKFDSSDDRIKINDIQIGPSVYQELTMTAWVYMDSFGANCWVVNQEIGGHWNRAILIDDGRCGGGKLGAAKGGGCGNSNLSVTQPSIVGKWSHVAATYKHGEFSYTFLDGVKSNNLGAPTHGDGDSSLAIGASATWFGLNCYARVSSVRIYDRVLTDAEINEEVGIGPGVALGSPAQSSPVQDWVHVATLTSYTPTIVSETEIEACDDCKLSDDAINALDFSLLRFEPITPSASHPITYFDFSNKIFDSTAVVEPCSTPWTLSETDALAGTFGGEETETCCVYTVCNFGRGHCGGTVKTSYGWNGYGGCGLQPVVGLSSAQYGSGVRIYVWSLPFGTMSPTTSPTTSPPTLVSFLELIDFVLSEAGNNPLMPTVHKSPTHSPSSSPTYTPRLAKYVKIQLASSGSLSVNEVQVINESSTNVAVSFAVAVTMSSTDGGNVPANVVDGDTNTAARTLDESMPWLQIELAQETDISKVLIDSDSELSSARVSLIDENGKTVFAAEGSVLAAATNGSGALEINGPDFQNAVTTSPSPGPTTVCPPLQVSLSCETKPLNLLLSPTKEQSANLSPDAIAPLSITGTINFDEVGMCEVEDMAGFIAATESVLAETACGDYSNCAVRIVSVCGVPVENIDMGTRKLQSSVGADYEYEVTLERACGTANCDDAQAVADQTFASVQQDINAAIQDGSFVAQLQTHTQGSSGSLATMLTNTTLTANMDRVVVVGSENSLYYPDWTKSNGGCKTGGGQPLYMTLAPLTWMETTLEGCCEKYYGWMLNECKGTSGGAPSGLWYPDWAGQDDTCKNDGNEPEYMASNPIAWMKSSKQDCCEANFIWMLNECLGSSSGPDDGATSKWFIDWDDYKCKRDCAVGTGPSCGGHAESWDELFDTRSACCSTKAAWNPTDCLVD
ncbi:hypothetical protein THAOC_14401, partial [Thalassiosira oceanica]